MTDFKNFSARPSLYRVWIPLRDDGRIPLISIWIDPTMTAFERQEHHVEIETSVVSDGAIAEEIDGPSRRGPYERSGYQSGSEFVRKGKLAGRCAA